MYIKINLEITGSLKNRIIADIYFQDDIYDDIKDRDYQDSHRKLNPLVKAEDAVLLDTSEMSIEEVVDAISAEADRVSAK